MNSSGRFGLSLEDFVWVDLAQVVLDMFGRFEDEGDDAVGWVKTREIVAQVAAGFHQGYPDSFHICGFDPHLGKQKKFM